MGVEHVTGREVRAAAEHAARTSRARLVSILAASHGDLAIAEDAVAAAFERALVTWPRDGIPSNPQGWLLTVARNAQRDTWKSSAYRTSTPLEAVTDIGADSITLLDNLDLDAIPDRRLALLFTCAHPAINPAARTPLMLQAVLGFDSDAIADAYVLPAPTLAKRLTRAKRRIREACIPFVVPDRQTMPERLPAVLEAVYGCFAIAWADADGSSPDATESMAGEALYLAFTLASLLNDEPEAWGLSALIAFSLSRAAGRRGPYVPLNEQDPSTWDAGLIADGEAMLQRASSVGQGGRFQLEAAMQAVHAARRRTGLTDWPALATLSAGLVQIAPTLGAQISHAAIITKVEGPAAGLALLDAVMFERPEVARLQAFHATRADTLLHAEQPSEAVDAYARAIELTSDERARTWLVAQQREAVR